jgi:outer membrane protein OmpA-like peptidoglycan-associated protein
MFTTRQLAFVLLGGIAGSALSAQVFTPPQIRRPKESDARQAFTVGADEPGCKDSLLMPRVAGCSILQCESKEADSVELLRFVEVDGTPRKEEVDGASETIYYLCPAKATHAAIVTAAEARLIKDGFKVVARSNDGDDEHVIIGVKDRQFVQVSTYTYENSNAYVQTALLADPEAQIDAETVELELTKSGRVTLTGFKFDRDKTDLPSGSETLLDEVAALLVKKPDWKIRVEAQCDEAVDPAQCSSLRERRAAAFAGSLVAKGVDNTRVTATPLDTGAATGTEDPGAKAHVLLVKY